MQTQPEPNQTERPRYTANPSSPEKPRHVAPKPDEGGTDSDTDSSIVLTRRQFALALAGVAVLAAVPTAIVSSCVSRGTSEQEETEEWKSRYDWEYLVRQDNGFYAYVKNGVKLSEAGVDVSEHDGSIDWAQVKAAGADFAMLRLGYRGYGQGTIVLDNYFLANIVGANEAGLKVGVYFFSQAITEEEAREEANYVMDTVKGTGVTLSYPVVFDEEPITNGDVARTDGMSNEQYSKNALAFCKEVEAGGYTPMIYGNQHDLAKLDLTGDLGNYGVWYAEYGVSSPTGKFDFEMWQYTESGSVSGIVTSDGQVDMDIRFLGE